MSNSARLRFWFLTALAVAVIALFCRLALWQYQRAHERKTLLAAVHMAVTSPATRLAAAPASMAQFAHVRAEGRYDRHRQVLLLEMPQPDGQGVGVEVLTPLHMVSGGVLLVNRGWVRADAEGRTKVDIAPPRGLVRVRGYLSDLPSPGLRLGHDRSRSGTWPRRFLYPRWSTLRRLYGPALLRRVLLLQPDVRGGYDRMWRLRPEHGPQENYGYMAQWLGLAATVAVVWFVLTLRSRRRRRTRSKA